MGGDKQAASGTAAEEVAMARLQQQPMATAKQRQQRSKRHTATSRRPVLRIPKAGWIRAAPGVCLMGKGDSVSQQRRHDDDDADDNNGKEADDSL